MFTNLLVAIVAMTSLASSSAANNFNPNSHIVVMKPHVNEIDVNNLAEHVQASHMDKAKPSFQGSVVKRLKNLKMFVVEAPSEEALSFLKAHGDVAFTEQDLEVHIDPIERKPTKAPQQEPPGLHKGRKSRRMLRSGKIDTTAADTYFYYWGLDRIDQDNAIVNPLPAYSTSPTAQYIYEAPQETNSGDNVAVYVLDTGIDTNHNEFQNNPDRVVQNVWNAYGPLATNTDGDGHGTHCAGTVGGYEAGVAPSADLFGVKVLDDSGSGSWTSILDGVDYVVGLKQASPDTPMVISMSLGGNCGSNCESSSINTGVDVAADAGIAVVVAAGNDNVDACWAVPASASKVITVGATTTSDARSSFSNYGRCLEIYAPGSDIISACSDGTGGCVGQYYYSALSGTSMAAPHVSGVVALMLAQTGKTSVTHTEVKELLACNAAVNKVSDARPESPNLLLQLAPVTQSSFSCTLPESTAPSNAPVSAAPVDPVPSAAPTEVPTAAPVVPVPTNTPVYAPTPAPTDCSLGQGGDRCGSGTDCCSGVCDGKGRNKACAAVQGPPVPSPTSAPVVPTVPVVAPTPPPVSCTLGQPGDSCKANSHCCSSSCTGSKKSKTCN